MTKDTYITAKQDTMKFDLQLSNGRVPYRVYRVGNTYYENSIEDSSNTITTKSYPYDTRDGQDVSSYLGSRKEKICNVKYYLSRVKDYYPLHPFLLSATYLIQKVIFAFAVEYFDYIRQTLNCIPDTTNGPQEYFRLLGLTLELSAIKEKEPSSHELSLTTYGVKRYSTLYWLALHIFKCKVHDDMGLRNNEVLKNAYTELTEHKTRMDSRDRAGLSLAELKTRHEHLKQKRNALSKEVAAAKKQIDRLDIEIHKLSTAINNTQSPSFVTLHSPHSALAAQAAEQNLVLETFVNGFIPLYINREFGYRDACLYDVYGVMNDKFTMFRVTNTSSVTEDLAVELDDVRRLFLRHDFGAEAYVNLATLSKITGLSAEKARQAVLVTCRAPKLPISYEQFINICSILKTHETVKRADTKDKVLEKIPELQVYINELLA